MPEKTLLIEKPGKHTQLAPCPFCGCDEIIYEQYEHLSGPRWRVCCCGCIATIDPGYAQNKFTVQRMWNRRK